jgi:anti-anti-sigma factor
MYPTCQASPAVLRLLCSLPATARSARHRVTFHASTPRNDCSCRHRHRERSCRAELVIAGELDSYAADAADEPCRDWLTSIGRLDVIVDLSAVTLIDSAGTRLIERLADAVPGRLTVRAPSRIVRRVFDLLNVAIDEETPAVIEPLESHWQGRGLALQPGLRRSSRRAPASTSGDPGVLADCAR